MLFVNYSTESLWLGDNQLNGTIPSQVGQLTQLGEFTVIDCHSALAQSLWASILIRLVILMVFWNYCAATLDLLRNTLTGLIPSEIASLGKLGEFVGCLVALFLFLELSALMTTLLVCFPVSLFHR